MNPTKLQMMKGLLLPTPVKKGHFQCGVPFTILSVYPAEYNRSDVSGGVVNACCHDWLTLKGRAITKKLETITKENLLEIWNSPEYEEFRKSITSGTYEYCNTNVCPIFISQVPVTSNPLVVSDSVPIIPPRIGFAADSACNLLCPSCRSIPWVTPNINSGDNLRAMINTGTPSIFLNGSGELFMNTPILEILRSLTKEQAPHLKNLSIITNGTLINKRMWDSLSEFVKSIASEWSVSVDAASASTYSKVRRPGNFESTLSNIEFLGTLRRQGTHVKFLTLNLVVQRENLHEIEDFLDLVVRVGADSCNLNTITNWYHDPTYFKDNFAITADELQMVRDLIVRKKSTVEFQRITIVSNV